MMPITEMMTFAKRSLFTRQSHVEKEEQVLNSPPQGQGLGVFIG
jgi:hypothetical protein